VGLARRPPRRLGPPRASRPPLRCKASASARLNNDKVDARTLAHLVRADLLPDAWIAPKEVRDLRTKLRFRVRLARTQGAFRNRVRAVLADHGIAEPHSLWTKAGRAWLDDVDLPAVARRVVDDSLAVIDAIDPLVTKLEKEIRAEAKPDPRVDALTTLHGAGPISAMTLIADIGDIARFTGPRKLCAWAGLTPNVRNSADKVRHGHITKQGSPWVRWILIEAAHKAKPPYAIAFAEITRRRGKKIATVAIARKLPARCYWLLSEAS
jgi:transposase